MKMRSILVIAAAAVVLLAAAAPALARAEARATTDPAPVPYGWLLQLRGAKKTSMTSYAFSAWMKQKGVKATIVDDNKTAADPSDDLTYTGVALWRLVGRIDDKNPATFNESLATTAPGYNVVIEAVDGFKVTYTSAEVATLKDTLVVAYRMNGMALSLGTASIKKDVASWKPNWPLKLVSSDATIFGSRKPAGVMRVSIEPATAVARAEMPVPYGWLLQLRGAKKTSMTSYAFSAWMKQKGVKATIVDDNKTAADPSDDLTYTGVALWRLVGRIDDKNPATFNESLATTAPGYNVVIEAVDGFKVTYTSAEVATLKDTLVVAYRMNGMALSLGTASIKKDVASWKPNWPLKLVSSDATIFGSRKPAGVMRVSIEPATTAPVSQAAPFEQATEDAPSARATGDADTPPEGGWTLTLQGKLKKVLPIATFPAKVAWDGSKAGNINPSLRYVYKGQSLYRLLALVDDKRPGTFNLALAKKGYTVKFYCRDGYTPKISSRLVLKNGTPRKTWIVAKLKAGKLLEGGEAPFRFVGGPPITQPFNNKLSAYGVIKIRLIF